MQIDLSRIVRLGVVSPKNNNILLKNVVELIKKDNKLPITLTISSNGGSVDAGFGIYDALCNIFRLPLLYTIGVGNVDSMAILLFAMGKKRFITPNTTLLFHEFKRRLDRDEWCTPNELISFGQDLEKRQQTYINIIAKNTNGKTSASKIQHLMKKNYRVDAAEAVEMGLAEMIDEKFTFSF